jgi:hypothetical protein
MDCLRSARQPASPHWHAQARNLPSIRSGRLFALLLKQELQPRLRPLGRSDQKERQLKGAGLSHDFISNPICRLMFDPIDSLILIRKAGNALDCTRRPIHIDVPALETWSGFKSRFPFGFLCHHSPTTIETFSAPFTGFCQQRCAR